MEDTDIYQGEFVYSFRLDMDYDNEEHIAVVEKKLQEYFSRYTLAKENKKDNTKHLQGILWRQSKLGKNDPATIRTFFKQKFNLGKNALSLVSARKVKSLASYCNDKEGKGIIIYNVNTDLLGKWNNPDAIKVVAEQEFKKQLQKYKLQKEQKYPYGAEVRLDECVMIGVVVYKKYNVRPLPEKSIAWKAYTWNIISIQSFTVCYYGDYYSGNIEATEWIENQLNQNNYLGSEN